MSSSGPAYKRQNSRLGLYEPIPGTYNDAPAWKRVSSSGTAFYLHRFRNGRWYVGLKVGGNTCFVCSKKSSELPFNLAWRYSKGGGNFSDDETLRVEEFKGELKFFTHMFIFFRQSYNLTFVVKAVISAVPFFTKNLRSWTI